MQANEGPPDVLYGQQSCMKREAMMEMKMKMEMNKVIPVYIRSMCHTLPSDASSSFTGHSRTDVTKQYEAGSRGDAAGYQAKSKIGAA